MPNVQAPTIINQLLPGHAGRGRNGYNPQIICVHTQAGTGNPFGWFQSLGTSGANAADSTIWNPAAANANLVRYLYDSDTAWTNGSWTEPINHANPVLDGLYKAGIYSGDVSLTVENEGNQTFTDAQYTRLAQLCAYWCDAYNILPDRNHIVGHSEIGPHKQCPGPNFDFDRLVKMTQDIIKQVHGVTQTLNPNVQYFQATGFYMDNDYSFLDYWNTKGGLELFGYPVTGAYYDPVKDAIVQYTERARFENHAKAPGITNVQLGRVGAELLAKG